MTEMKIVKVGSSSAPSSSKPTGSKRKKSMKTFPRGVLKRTSRQPIVPVRDPARAPPARRGTLRILTERGAEKHRKRIKKTVRTMPDSKVRETLQKAGLSVSAKAPPQVAREILESGMEAGMIVAK